MTTDLPWLKRLLPFLEWPDQWRRIGIRGDVVAGITVGLVLVPQALAYAQLASLPPHIGLYAALLPAVIAALFGSCGAIATGPVALTSLLTGASVIAVARPGTEGFLEAAIVLAMLSGAIQLALGGMRLGWLLKLLSRPVMTGFINASALLIALSQVPSMLGLRMARSEHFMVDFLNMLTTFTDLHLPALVFGLATLATLIVMRRFAPKAPGVLIVVAIATAISAATGFEAGGGRVVGHVPQGLPDFVLPSMDWNLIVALFPAAFVIALVSFMEVTASASVINARTGERWRQNQELIGQGLAKIAAAFSGGMPVSGSFSRSALNFASGARTGLSSIVSAMFVIITLLFLTPLLWHLPIAVLAAVIVLVVFNLFDLGAFRRSWQAGRDDGVAAAATFLSTLAFAPNIQNGILVGLLISLSLMLYRDMQPRVALLALHSDGSYRDLERFGLPHPHPNLVIMRFDSALTFVTSELFEDATANALRAQPDVRVLLVSAAGINNVDSTGLDAISALHARAIAEQRTLAFCGLKKQVIDAMERTGLWERLQPHAHYRTEQHALDALLPELPEVPDEEVESDAASPPS